MLLRLTSIIFKSSAPITGPFSKKFIMAVVGIRVQNLDKLSYTQISSIYTIRARAHKQKIIPLIDGTITNPRSQLILLN
jgi:hypothetical protein